MATANGSSGPGQPEPAPASPATVVAPAIQADTQGDTESPRSGRKKGSSLKPDLYCPSQTDGPLDVSDPPQTSLQAKMARAHSSSMAQDGDPLPHPSLVLQLQREVQRLEQDKQSAVERCEVLEEEQSNLLCEMLDLQQRLYQAEQASASHVANAEQLQQEVLRLSLLTGEEEVAQSVQQDIERAHSSAATLPSGHISQQALEAVGQLARAASSRSNLEPAHQAHNRRASLSHQRSTWLQSHLHEVAGGVAGLAKSDSADDLPVTHPKSVTEQIPMATKADQEAPVSLVSPVTGQPGPLEPAPSTESGSSEELDSLEATSSRMGQSEKPAADWGCRQARPGCHFAAHHAGVDYPESLHHQAANLSHLTCLRVRQATLPLSAGLLDDDIMAGKLEVDLRPQLKSHGPGVGIFLGAVSVLLALQAFSH